MFATLRRMQKLLLPADGVDPATLDGPGDETALDVGGEFFGDGDGSGKAFWPGLKPQSLVRNFTSLLKNVASLDFRIQLLLAWNEILRVSNLDPRSIFF